MPADWVTGCCLLVRRDCLEQLGGFDPDFFLYYEDVDLCRRAREQGWTVAFEPTKGTPTTVLNQIPPETLPAEMIAARRNADSAWRSVSKSVFASESRSAVLK